LCSVASELSDVVIPLESTTYRLKRELVVWPQHLIHMEFWNHILNQRWTFWCGHTTSLCGHVTRKV